MYLWGHLQSKDEKLKIAIMGMGVAGSYLMARLKDTEHHVTGYERSKQEKHDSICAWGTIKITMIELCNKVGIDFKNYVIHDGKKMHVKMHNQKQFDIGLHGLCTYNKIGLIQDFIKDCDVRYGEAPTLEEMEKEYDLIVDCTGFYRMYLPKLERDFFVQTYEYRIEYEDKVPFDDFYIKPFPGMSGYFWYFPLGEKVAHIGAGDYNKQHVKETDEFFKKYGGKVTKTVGRPIRLATPDLCKPFFSGKVVGVGESIGTVYPLLGEGIIPSMMCADIFLKHINDNKGYEKEVDEYFKIYGKVFSFIRKKIHHKFSIIKSLAEVLAIFRYMKKNEDRFGMEIHMRDLMKVAKA